MKKFFVFFIFLTGYFLILPKLLSASAIKFSLVAPSGTLTRGQTVRFTINIDSQGATITSTQIGMTYETQYLQYVGITPGSAMTTVSSTPVSTGKLLFSGSNNSGFTGQGVFAYVDLKIIAESSGSTQLCVLWAPSATPGPTATQAPTLPPGATAAPTTAPQVTTLPTSGVTGKGTLASSIGIGFLLVFAVFYFLDKTIVFKKPKKS